MVRKFQRRIEDFTCENCGGFVKGNGYTNHCPACLWSKHVDVNPGDRAEKCQGLMKPIRIERKQDTYRILHRCEKCKIDAWNNASKEDDFDAIVKISSELNQ